ncbi:protein kinase domain-containing protein [Umezawaea tangerina]|uniref:Protein kinase-like protein n=1 Tax=Umezawaea tangerina TaxID=84725 RepID=A0A2T0T9D9_9PSEU|nr:hypothetical protein [Umezawaea tangerina]PRY42287.1 protein kinase-like protein [Umezawaea tangerina]
MATARFPSGAAYVEALQNTALCFDDPELKGARVELDKLQRPRAISGNFASVFSVTAANGRRYAIKCFTREVADQEVRYRAVSDHLAKLDHRWKVGFTYLPHGIMVEGRRYPILKMDWVEATSLTRWLDEHVHDSAAVARLADRFAELVGELEWAGIAHGDLQHGNLLVVGDGSLRLVDYDGMFVPALAGAGAAEIGHRNYQSPSRTQSDFDATIDRFSSWVIYLSLVAVAAEPALWGQLREEGGEYLLLTEDDFTDPDGSSRFSILLNHVAPEVRALVGHVQALVGIPPNLLPELKPIPVDSLSTRSAFHQPTISGLPAWMVDHVPEADPVPDKHFTQRGPVVWSATLLLVAFVVGAVLMGALAVVTPVAAAGFGAVGVVLWLADLAVLYLRGPEARAAKQARTQRDEARQARVAADVELGVATRRSDELVNAAKEIAETGRKRRQTIQATHGSELAVLNQEHSKHLAMLAGERTGISNQLRQELAQALLAAQAEHVRSKLAKIEIAASGLDGFGDKLIGSLQDAGIVTAADFDGVGYMVNGQFQNRIAQFHLTSGYSVRVPGIGEVKANRLEEWRREQERIARLTQPIRLGDGQLRVIEARFRTQMLQLGTTEQQAQAAAQQRKTLLNQRLTRDLAALDVSQRTATAQAAQEQSRHLPVLRKAQAGAERARHQYELAEQEARAQRTITYPRFVLFSLTGR